MSRQITVEVAYMHVITYKLVRWCNKTANPVQQYDSGCGKGVRFYSGQKVGHSASIVIMLCYVLFVEGVMD